MVIYFWLGFKAENLPIIVSLLQKLNWFSAYFLGLLPHGIIKRIVDRRSNIALRESYFITKFLEQRFQPVRETRN